MKKILNKILEEINKESPRLDYIRGLIEASVEEEDTLVRSSKVEQVPVKNEVAGSSPAEPAVMDEVAILEAETKAHVAKFGTNSQVE